VTGRVTRWFPKYLEGWIAGEDGQDYHVRAKDVAGEWLTVGQLVRFEISNNWSEWIAVEVQPVKPVAGKQEKPRAR